MVKKLCFLFARSHLVHSTMDQVWKRKYLNIFFTTVFGGERIYLNIFLPPYLVGRKYSMTLGRFPTPIIVGVRRSCVSQKILYHPAEATMYSSSEDLSRNGYFVSDKLSTCYNLFHLSRFPVSFRYIDITITPHTNRKMSQATSHCLKYIFPFSIVVGKKKLNIFSPPKIWWWK